jgi:hypothetical protein
VRVKRDEGRGIGVRSFSGSGSGRLRGGGVARSCGSRLGHGQRLGTEVGDASDRWSPCVSDRREKKEKGRERVHCGL